MTYHGVHGLYRMCWVMTILLSALTVLSFYDRTREFSGYGPRSVEAPPQDWRAMKVVSIPDVGTLFIPSWMPTDPDDELRMNQQCRELARKGSSLFVVSEIRRINWVKMGGLMFGATAVFAFLIQGTAALLVGVMRVVRSSRDLL